MMVYYNPHITGECISSPTNPLNNQGPSFSLLSGCHEVPGLAMFVLCGGSRVLGFLGTEQAWSIFTSREDISALEITI